MAARTDRACRNAALSSQLSTKNHCYFGVSSSMKFKMLAIVFTLGAVAACANTRPIAIDNAVGPDNLSVETGKDGSLIVYSALNGFTTRDSDHPRHTNYDIYLLDGTFMRTVINRSGSFAQDPLRVSLPAGHYRIVARAANVGKVALPILIVAGRTTTVDLNKELSAQSTVATENAQVTLPNGQVIGSRAN